MDTKDQIRVLQTELLALNRYKTNLNEENLKKFEVIKNDITMLLNDSQRLRFNRIEFYVEKPDYSNIKLEDLPF